MVIGGAAILLLVILGLCIRQIVRERERRQDSRLYAASGDFKERLGFWKEALDAHPGSDPYRLLLWIFYNDRRTFLSWGEEQRMPASFEESTVRGKHTPDDKREGGRKEWQPIESAPKDGSWILVFCVNGISYVAKWNGSYEEWSLQNSGISGVTHWCPLPKAPTDEQPV